MSQRRPPSDDDAGVLRDGTHVAVRHGTPTHAELAALVAALDAGDGGHPPAPGRPAWQRAARLEGSGRVPRVAAPSDLDRGRWGVAR